MRGRRPALAALSLIALCIAAVPPRTGEELRSAASHIVVGDVRFVYAGEERVEQGTNTRYCIELAVARVEKSFADAKDNATTAPATPPTRPAVTPGQLVYARCWRPAKRPDGWAGHQGQNLIPKPGQRLRLYLARDQDGGFDVLTPNGVEAVKE